MKRMMKTFAMLFCIATLGLTTSCSNDNEDLIVGKWKCIGGTITKATPDSPEKTTRTFSGEETMGIIFEFTTDGKLHMIYSQTGDIDIYQYSISGDNLIIIDDEDDDDLNDVYQIKTLTKKKLTLHQKEDEMNNGGYYYEETLNFDRM